ncbi:MAG: S41 family peptidase [Flavobacteriaceae bacterium]|nr:S41 family peptidase [Flavobacteriaceae bacterium]
MNTKTKIFLPLIISLAFLVGYIFHYFTEKKEVKENNTAFIENNRENSSKISEILERLDDSYYKKVNKDSIEEALIPEILKNFDPHTAYISAKEMKQVREDMQGHFSGIGVQFIQYEDTIMVVRPIPEGPSDRVGILAGDRIVTVNDDTIASRKIKTDSIMRLLKGKAGSQVNLGIFRPKSDSLQYFKVIRGDVNVSTVDIAYMLDAETGYIKINQFGYKTYNEFIEALEELKQQNIQRLVIDLRGNVGGLLGICVAMLNEFLEKGELIVYTKGLHSPRIDKRANGNGRFKDIPLVVLIDSYSASASEIFAGAIQDHDRGIIVGRRSFGKGLVQEQIEYTDGSALRLTVAEYFTPSGRNIQKPFKMGDREDYDNDINERYKHGEFAVADSIQFADSLQYKTDKGRIVYGGGGIMPDVFVPLDTTTYSKYYEKLQRKFLVRDFAYHFADKHRAELSALKDYKKMEDFIKKHHYMQEFVAFSEKKGVKKDRKGYQISKELLENQILALIVRNIIDEKGFYPIYHRTDAILKKGIESFEKEE